MFVYVTNKNDFVHHDRFNGQDFIFHPNKAEVVPFEAASHMFGWNKKDKTPTLLRLGWANDGERGVKKLAKFVISEAKFEKPPEAEEVAQPEEVAEEETAERPISNPNRPPVFAGQPRANRQAPQ
jgi:hypothetical protein